MLSEVSQKRRGNIMIPLYELPRIVKYADTKWDSVLRPESDTLGR